MDDTTYHNLFIKEILLRGKDFSSLIKAMSQSANGGASRPMVLLGERVFSQCGDRGI